MTSKHFLTSMEHGAITPAYMLDSVAQVRFYRALHQCVSQHIALLPEHLDLRTLGVILDLACGPGFWVRDVAATYPQLEVVGLDVDPDIVLCAHKLTPITLNKHAQFMHNDMCEPILGRHCVGLLHLRFLASTISPLEWMYFVDDIIHLCRPDGYIVWTEAHLETNSTACTEIYTLLQRAMGKSTTCSPIDITPMMDVLLGDTICQKIERSSVQLDLSVCTPLHVRLLNNIVGVISILQPFLSAQHVASTEEIDRICREFLIAVHEETFVCHLSLVTVTGHIPLA